MNTLEFGKPLPPEVVIVIEEDGNISEIYSIDHSATVKVIIYGSGECDESLKEIPGEDTYTTKVIHGKTFEQLVQQIKEEHD